MSLELVDVVRSLRRSRLRREVLRAALELGVAPPAEIAERAGVPPERMGAVLYGRLPGFRPSFSLVGLGLLRRRWTRHGAAYEPTEWGVLAGRLVAGRVGVEAPEAGSSP